MEMELYRFTYTDVDERVRLGEEETRREEKEGRDETERERLRRHTWCYCCYDDEICLLYLFIRLNSPSFRALLRLCLNWGISNNFLFFHPDLCVIFKQQKLTLTNSMKTFTYCNIILTCAASIHNLTKNINDKSNDVLLFRIKHVNY